MSSLKREPWPFKATLSVVREAGLSRLRSAVCRARSSSSGFSEAGTPALRVAGWAHVVFGGRGRAWKKGRRHPTLEAASGSLPEHFPSTPRASLPALWTDGPRAAAQAVTKEDEAARCLATWVQAQSCASAWVVRLRSFPSAFLSEDSRSPPFRPQIPGGPAVWQQRETSS